MSIVGLDGIVRRSSLPQLVGVDRSDADASVMRNGMVQAGAPFLSKPYRGGQLAAAVRSLLDAKRFPPRTP